MIKKEITEYTDEELRLEIQQIKSSNLLNAVLIGVMIGVATYSTVKNGLGILTFFPIFFVPMMIKKRARKKILEQQMRDRNLTL